jgi:hypothetical protein
MAEQGYGSYNTNGLSLLGMCAEQELFITNTQFRLPNPLQNYMNHGCTRVPSICMSLTTSYSYHEDSKKCK